MAATKLEELYEATGATPEPPDPQGFEPFEAWGVWLGHGWPHVPFCDNARSIHMDRQSAELEAAELDDGDGGATVVRLLIGRA